MKKKPFRNNGTVFQLNDPSHAFLSTYNQKSHQKLIAGIRDGNKLLTLTGPAGCGKSVLIERIIHELADGVCLINVHWESLGTMDLIDNIGNKLAVDLTNKTELSEQVADLIGALSAQAKQNVIVLLDQADRINQQNLHTIILQIKAIGSVWEVDQAPFFQVLLVGASELELQFGMADLCGFAFDDEMVQVQLKALNAEETRGYILHYLAQINETARMRFSEAALERVIDYSGGIPRKINKLCDLAMLMASMEDKSISASLIDEVAENCLIVGDAGFKTNLRTDQAAVSDIDDSRIVDLTDSLSSKPDTPRLQHAIQDTAIATAALLKELDSSSHFASSTQAQSEQIDDDYQDTNDVPGKNRKFDLLKTAMGIVAIAVLGIGAVKLGSYNAGRQTASNRNLSKSQVDGELDIDSQGKALSDNSDAQKKPAVQQENIPDEHAAVIYKDNSKENQLGNGADVILQQSDLKREVSGLQAVETVLSGNNNKRIRGLLDLANQQLIKKQLMTPVGDSAWLTYQEILALSPGNQQALDGVEKIKTTYVLWAQHEISKGNYKHAKYLLSKALEISPEDPEILLIKSEIDLETETEENVSLRKTKPGSIYRNRSSLSNGSRHFWYNFARSRAQSNDL